MKNKKNHIDTRVVHAGVKPEPITGAVMTPIFASSTFAQKEPGKHSGYEYGRSQNPTRDALEDSLANLENGSNAFVFSSGLAAQSAVLEMLKPGDHIIAFDDLYGGTFRLLEEIKSKSSNLEISYVDYNKVDLNKIIRNNTKLIWIETPTNPLLKITDLKKIASIAKKHKVLTICDNTFASPINQKPLDLGIDIVNHSTTKYINGHSDIIGGALIIGKNKKLADKISFIQNSVGAIPSPFDCFLILRAIKTLSLRMKQHNYNGLKVAKYLEKHKKIIKVVYPGLTTHSQHKIAKKQMDGYGAVVTFFHKGNLKEIKRFMQNLKIFTIAESLGGVESLIESPALMTHAYVNTKAGQLTPIPENLIRISVGIEHVDDLIEDLKQAL
ncbi:PLP-dependent aspartate aminotransferase family protein [Pelagibacteraceae bacterium]|nr:PLP-dependent aspartate aminotransferase family protein [Pelagibacteraceae bacterium]